MKTALIGLFLGLLGLGLPTLRQILVQEGHWIKVIPITVLASCSMYLFTYMVAEKDIPFMIGNTIGACIAISRLAYKQKKKLEKK